MRLCSLEELEGNEARGSGCQLDNKRVWSSTECGKDRVYVAAGRARASSPSTKCRKVTSTYDVRCCAESDLESSSCCQGCHECSDKSCKKLELHPTDSGSPDVCSSSKPNGKCSGQLTFGEAKEFCESGQMRLCSLNELKNDEARDTGCGFDYKRVWSSTQCGRTSYYAAAGQSPSPSTRCRGETKKQGVRCCADADLATPYPCCDLDDEGVQLRKVHLEGNERGFVGADGRQRGILLFNEQFPGPEIRLKQGDDVVIYVENQASSRAFTIHWHGMHQRGTPWSDGTPKISQCEIGPMEKFRYEFTAAQYGTYWYHTHTGDARAEGLAGPLIIEPEEELPPEYTQDDDINIMVTEWLGNLAKQRKSNLLKDVFRDATGQLSAPFTSWDGNLYLEYEDALINGMGKYEDNTMPLSVFNVKRNQRIRFRFLHQGFEIPFMISIDGHLMTVVASDGYDIVPLEDQTGVVLQVGERYDVIVNTDQPIDNYWIRAKTVLEPNYPGTNAILRYKGAPETDPITEGYDCTTSDSNCRAVNCPWPAVDQEGNPFRYTECTRPDQLRAAQHLRSSDEYEVPAADGGDIREYFFNTQVFLLNGRSNTEPSELMLLDRDISDRCTYETEPEFIGETCVQTLTIPFDKPIQFVFYARDAEGTSISGHPMHLHGHSFYVVKQQFGEFTDQPHGPFGQRFVTDDDLECDNESCNRAHFASDPNVNLDNPPQKDILFHPYNGYSIVRFQSNNPGLWLMHCHILIHTRSMSIIVEEAPEMFDELVKDDLPSDFPVCGTDFGDISAAGSDSQTGVVIVLSIAVGVLCLIIIAIFGYLVYKRRQQLNNYHIVNEMPRALEGTFAVNN